MQAVASIWHDFLSLEKTNHTKSVLTLTRGLFTTAALRGYTAPGEKSRIVSLLYKLRFVILLANFAMFLFVINLIIVFNGILSHWNLRSPEDSLFERWVPNQSVFRKHVHCVPAFYAYGFGSTESRMNIFCTFVKCSYSSARFCAFLFPPSHCRRFFKITQLHFWLYTRCTSGGCHCRLRLWAQNIFVDVAWLADNGVSPIWWAHAYSSSR